MRIDFLSNHGLMGGGEVMLFQMAAAALGLGHQPVVIAPQDSEVARRAVVLELPLIAVPGTDRRTLARSYSTHSRTSNAELLWCNGPVPSMATITAKVPRIVHLHQYPSRSQAVLLRAARRRALATLVPSLTMAAAMPGTTAFQNWTDEPPATGQNSTASPVENNAGKALGTNRPARIGYIGRISRAKGLDVLADAVGMLRTDLDVRLVVAGDDRFVPDAESAPVRAALARISDRVSLAGWTDRDTFHQDIDLLVVPSTWNEPFGLVAAEALARRTPLLVTNAGALPEIVGPGYPWVAQRQNPAALAAVMKEMVFAPARVADFVEQGAVRWRQHFSPAAGRTRLATLIAEWETRSV